jgi:hypothetical protein
MDGGRNAQGRESVFATTRNGEAKTHPHPTLPLKGRAKAAPLKGRAKEISLEGESQEVEGRAKSAP